MPYEAYGYPPRDLGQLERTSPPSDWLSLSFASELCDLIQLETFICQYKSFTKLQDPMLCNIKLSVAVSQTYHRQ